MKVLQAIGLTGDKRRIWVSDKLHRIDAGDVRHVIRILKGYHGLGSERITNLSEYLKRFIDAVDYDYFRAKGLSIGSGEVESAITLHSPEALEDSRGDLASRYSKSHAGECELFGLMAGGTIFGRGQATARQETSCKLGCVI